MKEKIILLLFITISIVACEKDDHENPTGKMTVSLSGSEFNGYSIYYLVYDNETLDAETNKPNGNIVGYGLMTDFNDNSTISVTNEFNDNQAKEFEKGKYYLLGVVDRNDNFLESNQPDDIDAYTDLLEVEILENENSISLTESDFNFPAMTGVWNTIGSFTTMDLHSIDGIDNDIYVVGGHIKDAENTKCVYHFNGSEWNELTGYDVNNPFVNVHYVSTDNIYMTTCGGKLIHYNGTSFSTLASFSTGNQDMAYHLGFKYVSDNEIYLGGYSSIIYKWDGTDLVTVFDNSLNDSENMFRKIRSIGGTIYAMTTGGKFYKKESDSDNWSLYFSITELENPENGSLNDFWGENSSEIFTCGLLGQIYKWDGSEYSLQPEILNLDWDAFYGEDKSELYIMGYKIYKYDQNQNTWLIENFANEDLWVGWCHNMLITPNGTKYAVGGNGLILNCE